MPVASSSTAPHERFQQTLSRLESALGDALRAAIPRIASALERVGETSDSKTDRQRCYAVSASLRVDLRSRVGASLARLRAQALRCVECLQRTAGQDERAALALIEEDELRAQILAAELAAAVRQLGADDYAAYAHRTRALLPGLWEDDDLNPLGARTIAAAAQAAFSGLEASDNATPSLRKALAAHLAPALVGAVDEVDRWLREQGVQPLVAPAAVASEPAPAASQTTVAAPPATPLLRLPPGSPASAAGPENDGASTPMHSAGDPPWPDRSMQASAAAARTAQALASSPLAAHEGRAGLATVPRLQSAVQVERDALAFAHELGVVPYGREARAGFFAGVRARLRDAEVPPAQTAVVDVVAALFEYVIDDQRLPQAAGPLLWRLQQPALALALLDSEYLGDDARSVRRLVENLGAIVNAYPGDIERGSELFTRLEVVVRAVEVIADALQARSAVMARQVEQEYARAAENVGELVDRVAQERLRLEAAPAEGNRRDYRSRPGQAREQAVTRQLQALLEQRIAERRLPDSVEAFLRTVWLRHLRTAVLRDGEDSAEFRVGLQVVEDLLWTLDEDADRDQSRDELARRIPPLIRLLGQGLRSIGAREDEFKSFFDELFLIHLRKMQRGGQRDAARPQAPSAPDDSP